MKKMILVFTALLVIGMQQFASAQSRYLDEVFENVNVTKNVVYGSNYSVFPSFDTIPDLLVCDIYEPAGDWISTRPVIVYLHTGSFLPILINGTATGDLRDSATVEMCKQFARRGYVAVAMDYRLGWNPIGATQDIRTGTLLQAVYRALQDAKSCVRFLKSTVATQANIYRLDSNKIILGGQGSGGYLTLGYNSLNNPAEISLLKFLATTTDPNYGFVAGQPYVNQFVLGDFEGYGGLPGYNIVNSPGYGTKAGFVFNMGGALGDSTWLEAGDAPTVCFHVPNDPFAPYKYGAVIVPTTGQFVVNVSGSYDVVRLANQLGNNNSFNFPFNDPYTTRANQVNDGHYGLFPFVEIDPSLVIPNNPFHGQAGPWEWWDSTALKTIAPLYGVSVAQAIGTYFNGFLTNPDMSKAKGLRYIDSIQGYLAPRIVASCGLDTMQINIGISEVSLGNELQMFPNPAVTYFTLQLDDATMKMENIQLFDLTGRMVKEISNINKSQVQIAREELTSGLYMVRIVLANGKQLNGKMMMQ
ncbi:MAG: T9SS type A sorting domain-containing protein [Chitinophagales bacterium]|nr:T9SS type A sorting domain-containing protein [Chitinophagales bacterium]